MPIKEIILEALILGFSLFMFKLGIFVSLVIAQLIATWTRIEKLKPIVLGILIALITPVTLSFIFRFSKIDDLIYQAIKREQENKKWAQTMYQNQEAGISMISFAKNRIIAELELVQKAIADAEAAKKKVETQVANLQHQLQIVQQQLEIAQKPKVNA